MFLLKELSFPFPAGYLRHVNSVFADILLMLHKLVVHPLIQIGSAVAKLRQELYGVLYKMETVHIVLHPHVEQRRYGTLLLVAAHMYHPVIVPSVCQLMYQSRIAMEAE